MFSAACLLISAAILFYIVRYRIHIHISYSPRPSRVTDRRKGRELAPRPSLEKTFHFICSACRQRKPKADEAFAKPGMCQSCYDARQQSKDVASALLNLGCSKEKARSVATRVCAQPGTFEDQLRRALQEAA